MSHKLPDSDSEHDSLSAETRSQIDREFQKVFDQSRVGAAAVLQYLKLVLIALLVLIAAAYAVDYLALQQSPNPIASVDITRYYAVRLKNGKTEISRAESEIVMCVNSAFPHRGYWPCWYVRRHTSKEIQIGFRAQPQTDIAHTLRRWQDKKRPSVAHIHMACLAWRMQS